MELLMPQMGKNAVMRVGEPEAVGGTGRLMPHPTAGGKHDSYDRSNGHGQPTYDRGYETGDMRYNTMKGYGR
jgi:hypothetical protein